MAKEQAEFSSTVLLPKTAFPMRAELPKREPLLLNFWREIDVYGKMLEKRRRSPSYIFHDGPPYANGSTHIGHALNKILKDVVVKSKAMAGFWSPFVPGWDCHGLPIEHALLKELKLGKRHIEDVAGFRLKAREFAAKFIDIQRAEFKRLGVLADWENPYITMSPQYEGAVISAFLDLLRKGYVYRGKKAIYWCISCETALAEAEIEYKDKTSPSIYVPFKLADGSASIVIWTTTPWTLPANRAAAVCAEENYRLLKGGGENYIVADKLADSFMSECGLSCEKGKTIPGEKLAGLKYFHPFSDRQNVIVCADFVAMDTGTGIVHIAPGHGEDDFNAGLKLGLEIFCPVDERGKFTKEAGEFAGENVFESNPKIVEKLKADGKLLASKNITHSYPHCWRCKHPVIFRTTEQWFLGVDKHELRKKLVGEINSIKWIPSGGQERITAMVEQRPDWCLSRQRHWGTPIPIVYCKSCGEPQYDEKIFKVVEEKARKEGSDFWFSDPVEKIIPQGYKCKCGCADFEKETDILDVWLDSGVSWLSVLKFAQSAERPLYPADLYLEGSDQHRGWFQSSLIASTALEGRAPYKSVLTHGFVLDENGKAMHKSLGNVVSPHDIVSKYGAEILRLWVCLGDYSEDVRISDKLLEVPVDTYRKIRNTVRYLLGNLWDYEPKKHAISDDKMLEMDKYMLGRFAQFAQSAAQNYAEFKFRNAIRAIADFCILDMSAFYLDALKDRLYTLGTNSHERRSAQTALHEIALGILRLMAPVLSFTAEEAWQEMRKTPCGADLEESIFLSDFPKAKVLANPALNQKWEKIRQLRDAVLKKLEEARKAGLIGSSLEAKVTFKASGEMRDFIKSTIELWPSIAIISQAEISDGGELEILVSHADGQKCPRCWQWRTDIGADKNYSQVCARCAKVMATE